jgi:hypothetical protein
VKRGTEQREYHQAGARSNRLRVAGCVCIGDSNDCRRGESRCAGTHAKNAGLFCDSDTITKKDAGEIAVTVFARIISFYAVRG